MAFGDLKSGGSLTGAANSITNPFNVTGSCVVNVGDLIYAEISEQTTLTCTACGDNLHGGSSYTATNVGTTSGAITGRAFYRRVTVAGTLTSVNFVATASGDNVSAVVAVFEGPFDSSPLDANPGNITTQVTSPFTAPATGTLAQASEIVVTWAGSSGSTAWAATSPNTLGPQIATQAILTARIGYQTVNATTTVAPVFTAAANPANSVVGTNSFKQDLNIQRFQNTQNLPILIGRRRLYPRHRELTNLGGVDISETALVRSPFYLGRTFNTPRTQNRNFSVKATVVVTGDQDLSPDLYTDPDTFYAPTVVGGDQEFPAVGFTPPVRKPRPRFRQNQSVSTPFSTISQDLAPSLYTDPDTFYAPTVTGDQTIVARNIFFLRRLRVHPRHRDFSTFAVSDANLSPELHINDNIFYSPYVQVEEFTTRDPTPLNRARRRARRFDASVSSPVSQEVSAPNFIDPRIASRRRIVRPRNVSVSTPYSTIDFDLAPSLYTDPDTFYTPDVSLQEIPAPNFVDTRKLSRRRIPRTIPVSVSTSYSTINFDLSPSLYTNDNTFYSPTVSLQEIPAPNFVNTRTLSRRRIIRPRDFTVSTPSSTIDVDLAPNLYTNQNTFYTPTVTGGEVTIFPSLYVDDDIFYSPTVTAGSVDLSPSLYTNTNTFYSPTVDQEVFTPQSSFNFRRFRRRVVHKFDFSISTPYSTINFDLSPTLYTNDNTFYPPVVVLQEIPFQNLVDVRVRRRAVRLRNFSISTPYSTIDFDLTPSLYTDIDTFYTPVVSSAGDLAPTLYTDVDTFYSPSVVSDTIISRESFFLRRLRLHPHSRDFSNSRGFPLPEDVTLTPALYVDDDTFYTPTVSTVGGLSAELYTNTNIFYQSVVTIQDVAARQPFFIRRRASRRSKSRRNVDITQQDLGTADLTPGLYTDPDTFYSPTVQQFSFTSYTTTLVVGRVAPRRRQLSQGTPLASTEQFLFPSLYTNTNTFYDPTVSLQEIPATNFVNPRTEFRRRIRRHVDFSVNTPYSTIDFALFPGIVINDNTFYAPTVSLQEIPSSNFIDTRTLSRRRVVRLRFATTGTPYSTLYQELLPGLFVNDNTFYEPTVSTVGGLSADLYENVNIFYAPTITTGSVDVAPSLYSDGDTFYIPIVSLQDLPLLIADIPLPSRHRVHPRHRDFTDTGNDSVTRQDLFPSIFVNTNTFYSPTVTTGVVDLAPSLYTDDDIFYSPTINTVGNISPPYYVNENIFYEPVVFADIPGQSFYPSIRIPRRQRRIANYSTPVSTLLIDLSPSLYTNNNIFYSPIVLGGAINLQPSLYADDDTFYSPVVSTGAVDIAPSLYTNTNVFYSPIVIGINSLAPSLYVDVDTFYSPNVTAFQNIAPSLYINTNIHYTSSLSGGDKPLLSSLYENTNVIYRPTVVGPPSALSGIVGAPPTFVQPISVTVKGVILTATIKIIPGRVRTVSFLPGRVEVPATPILKSFKGIETSFMVLGSAIGDDILENIEELLLIISETLVE